MNSSGQVVATTTIGTNLLTGTLGTINGASLSAGGTITITAASSTLLANNNTWTGLQQFANASSTFETDSTLWLPNTTSVLLKTTGSGQVAAAIAGTDYQVPITASYPISFSGNNLSLVFGTTTANTFSQLQTLSGGASTTNLSASGEGYFATASTTNLTVSGSPSGFLQTNAQGQSPQHRVSARAQSSARSARSTERRSLLRLDHDIRSLLHPPWRRQHLLRRRQFRQCLQHSAARGRPSRPRTPTRRHLPDRTWRLRHHDAAPSPLDPTVIQRPHIRSDHVTSRNGLLFTPTVSGTLGNAGLTNSTIKLNGVTLTLGDLSDTISAASSTLLANNNIFSGNNTFSGGNLFTASTTIGNGNQNGGLTISGGATTTGNLIVQGSGTSTFLGNIGISGNIIPATDNTYTLGLASSTWKDVYIGPGSLYVDGEEVVHTTRMPRKTSSSPPTLTRILNSPAAATPTSSSILRAPATSSYRGPCR